MSDAEIVYMVACLAALMSSWIAFFAVNNRIAKLERFCIELSKNCEKAWVDDAEMFGAIAAAQHAAPSSDTRRILQDVLKRLDEWEDSR